MSLRIICALLFATHYCQAYAQDINFNYHNEKSNSYYDEDNNQIDKSTFKKKTETKLFYELRIAEGRNVYYKTQWSFYFDSFSNIEKQQLFKFLSSRASIDTSKIVVVHYRDSLKAIFLFDKRPGIENLPGGRHRHKMTHRMFVKEMKNCLKKFKRNKASNVYHYYSYNDGHPSKIDNMEWFKDSGGLFQNLFRRNIKSPRTIVIHPNGNYFLYYYYDTDFASKLYDDLIRDKGWDNAIRRFKDLSTHLNSYKKEKS
ncbi:hypothetical protein Q2T40_12790 [Winogradskyella maritima]|uniref:Uncharacterized protein n=1 Tax=Winogradskyella maritima TaxID=1517766 RepID=A0ABV8AGZ9_9FLAO|nr:hypothetical protein [Winogradskyella maritima]